MCTDVGNSLFWYNIFLENKYLDQRIRGRLLLIIPKCGPLIFLAVERKKDKEINKK